MKKILLTATLAAFAVAAQAGESKATSDKDAGCCAKAKATTTKVDSKETGSCCAAMAKSKGMHVTHVLQSPKAASLG